MKHIRCIGADEKGQILPRAVQTAAVLKGQSSELFSLCPSVTEKVPVCVSLGGRRSMLSKHLL